MKILSLDTSTPMLTMAISEGEKILFEYERHVDRECNKFLFPMMKEMFDKNGLSLDDMDAFAVSIGPGSFTGTRIGVTVIKGLAYFKKKPVVGISSLDIIASGLQGIITGLICPIIDARRNNLYSAIYEKNDGRLTRISDYLLVSLPDLLSRLNEDVFFLGDGLTLHRREILNKIPQAKIAANHFWYPKAANLGIIAGEKLSKGKEDSLFDLVPLYLYPKECTVQVKVK